MIRLDFDYTDRDKMRERLGLARLGEAEREDRPESRQQYPLSEDARDFALGIVVAIWTTFGIIGLITTFQMFRDLLL